MPASCGSAQAAIRRIGRPGSRAACARNRDAFRGFGWRRGDSGRGNWNRIQTGPADIVSNRPRRACIRGTVQP
jgi:hypothetical protein